jgi:hypothetical protein
MPCLGVLVTLVARTQFAQSLVGVRLRPAASREAR